MSLSDVKIVGGQDGGRPALHAPKDAPVSTAATWIRPSTCATPTTGPGPSSICSTACPASPERPWPPRIADLGCGPGTTTPLLAARWPDAHITGYDNSPQMLAEAERTAGPTPGGGRIDFAHADACRWTPAPGTYDLILSNATLQRVRDTRSPSPPGSTRSPPAARSPSRCPATSTPPATC
ncbi:Trans-aconitate 2-methyltransferase [Streptomyces alboniger]